MTNAPACRAVQYCGDSSNKQHYTKGYREANNNIPLLYPIFQDWKWNIYLLNFTHYFSMT